MRIVIAEKAENDLARIYAYLKNRYDLETAEHFRIRAEKALKQLGQQPELGPHPGWATRHKQLRFWLSAEPTTSFIMKLKPTRFQLSEFWMVDETWHRIVELGIEEPPDQTDEPQ